MAKELAHKKATKEQDRIIRELLNAKKHLRDEVKAVLQTAEAEQIENQFKDYHKRRDAQLAELTVNNREIFFLCLSNINGMHRKRLPAKSARRGRPRRRTDSPSACGAFPSTANRPS